MLLAGDNKKNDFQGLIPSISQNMAEWQFVSARLPGAGAADMQALAQRLMTVYGEKEGMIFPYADKVVMVQRLPGTGDSGTFKADLEQKLAGRGYSFIIRQMTQDVLRQVETRFAGGAEPAGSFFAKRQARGGNVVLVVDDDFFYRTLLRRECETFAQVHQSEDGKDVVKLYQEVNPDIVFLDIHLPSAPGLSILDQIANIDFDAFVVMLSADTSRQNVLQSIRKGAAGVLKKNGAASALGIDLSENMIARARAGGSDDRIPDRGP